MANLRLALRLDLAQKYIKTLYKDLLGRFRWLIVALVAQLLEAGEWKKSLK